jgi:hypothetical protein
MTNTIAKLHVPIGEVGSLVLPGLQGTYNKPANMLKKKCCHHKVGKFAAKKQLRQEGYNPVA